MSEAKSGISRLNARPLRQVLGTVWRCDVAASPARSDLWTMLGGQNPDIASLIRATLTTASVVRSDLCLEADPGYRHSASRKAFTRFSV
jgi:hypothetical protein